MKVSKTSIVADILEHLQNGTDIPFALARVASHEGINIDEVKQLMEDVDEKTSEIHGGFTGKSWEAEDEEASWESYSGLDS
jgi:hypothetical protein